MTPPLPRPGPLVPVAVAAAAVGVVAWVLALVRPWGDTGVDGHGSLAFGRPVGTLAVVGVVVVVALIVAVAAGRGARRSATLGRLGGAVVVVAAGVAMAVVVSALSAQVFPRDGGWWALVAAIGAAVSGVGVVLDGFVRPTDRRAVLGTALFAGVVPLALVAVAVAVAPGWPDHRLAAEYPARFSESAGPATVVAAAWRKDFGADATVAVLGGRVVVANDTGTGDGCRLRVQALDAGTGVPVWSVTRPLRCDGPRLASVDGNNTTVRVTLRARDDTGTAHAGAPLSVYFGTEDGRDRSPSSALDAVTWWTEGFGLVRDASGVRGLDSVTGQTVWTRPLPRCADGGSATVAVPGALPATTLASRTPYDSLGALPGSAPVTSSGNDTVFAATCTVAGRPTREVWLVDVLDGPSGDRVVALPPAPGGDDPSGATTFLPWLDTVIAVVPAAARQGTLHTASLHGVVLATGAVAWSHAPLALTSVDVSPVDGSLRAAQAGDGPSGDAATVVLDVHTGRVVSTRSATPSQASVSLTRARVTYDGSRVTVVDEKSGTMSAQFAVPDCPLDPTRTIAPLLAGPGGLVLRCRPEDADGASVVGLGPPIGVGT